jgi:hypothetical protein
MNGMVPYIISKEEMERVPAAERIMVTVFGRENCYCYELLA